MDDQPIMPPRPPRGEGHVPPPHPQLLQQSKDMCASNQPDSAEVSLLQSGTASGSTPRAHTDGGGGVGGGAAADDDDDAEQPSSLFRVVIPADADDGLLAPVVVVEKLLDVAALREVCDELDRTAKFSLSSHTLHYRNTERTLLHSDATAERLWRAVAPYVPCSHPCAARTHAGAYRTRPHTHRHSQAHSRAIRKPSRFATRCRCARQVLPAGGRAD
jgi:hypothetical protein